MQNVKDFEEDWRDVHVAMCSNCRHGNNCILKNTGYWFYPPFYATRNNEFNSYRNSVQICYKYEPSLYQKWVLQHWTNVFHYMEYHIKHKTTKFNKYIALIKGENRNIIYYVRYIDFFHNEFLNSDGTLQAYEKVYMKRTRKNEIGYKIIHEWIGEDRNKHYIFNI